MDSFRMSANRENSKDCHTHTLTVIMTQYIEHTINTVSFIHGTHTHTVTNYLIYYNMKSLFK